MSLSPAYQPLADEEEDRKRKAQIEEMMRGQRESYFRNEPVQQEYRDVVTRLANLEEARNNAAATDFREPGPFDLALAKFMGRRRAGESDAGARLDPQEPSDAFLDQPKQADKPELVRVAQAAVPTGHPTTNTIRPSSNVPTGGFDIPLRWDGENRVEEKQWDREERPRAIQPILKSQINYAAQKNGLGAEVYAGGQPPLVERNPKLPKRGLRHDYGNAADIDLYVIENGKRRYLDSQNPDDQKKMESFMRDVVIAGATGIGHGYMWHRGNKSLNTRIHVGGGEPAAWGAGSENAGPFPWVAASLWQSIAARKKQVPLKAWPHPVAPVSGGSKRELDAAPWDRFGVPKPAPKGGTWLNARSTDPLWSAEDGRLSLIRRMLDNYMK